MTQRRSAAVARRSPCILGRATFTTVPSIGAMLEPRIVAASTHVPARGANRAEHAVVRRTHSSAARGMTDAAPVTRKRLPPPGSADAASRLSGTRLPSLIYSPWIATASPAVTSAAPGDPPTMVQFKEPFIMTQQSIPAGAHIGHVHLKVSDIDRSIRFYHDLLGFDVITRLGDQAAFLSAGGYHHHLGMNTWESRGGSPPPPDTTGLYHFAVNYPSRRDLAIAARRLLDGGWSLDGMSDHITHEALYLHDPDFNGIELAWDRDVSVWRAPDGTITAGNRPLDLDGLLAEVGDDGWESGSIPAGARIGHIHLKVADLDRALHFYQDLMGFDLQGRMGGQAAFLSAGGYHHHLGLNTWESKGGSPPPRGTTGLYHFAINYPTRKDLGGAVKRLFDGGWGVDGLNDHGTHMAIYLHDPDFNGIELAWDRERSEWPRNADGSINLRGGKAFDLQALVAEA